MLSAAHRPVRGGARVAGPPPAGPAARTWRDAVALPSLLLTALLVGLAALARRPDLYGNGSFLFGDHALNLLLAERLAGGAKLYAGAATPYGPIPAYAYAGFSALFGNSVRAYNGFLLAASLLNVALAYCLLRRYASAPVALLVAGVGLLPSLLVPGGLLGGYTVSAYLPLERLLLLLAALCWQAPPRRPMRSAGLGVVLGLWQGVKFGGAFFGGAAVLLLDLLAIALLRRQERDLPGWIRSLLVTLAAFLAVEAGWAAWALYALPRPVAMDFLWPSYILDAYPAWVSAGERWPGWKGWGVFWGQYLSPVLGGAIGLAILAHLLRGRGGYRLDRPGERREMAGLALLLPSVFFAIASFAYFRQVHHFLQFAWALVIPAAWLVQRSGARTRAALALLFLPCWALNLKVVLLNPRDPGMRPVSTPSGETLWMAPRLAADVQALLRTVGPPGAGGARPPELLFLPTGAGVQHFYAVPVRVRQPWYLPGFFRPYDESDFLGALRRAGAVVLVRQPGQDPTGADPCAAMSAASPFPPRVCAAMAATLGEPVAVGRHFLVFPARERDGAARPVPVHRGPAGGA